MMEFETEAELRQLMKAHEMSVAGLVKCKQNRPGGELSGLSFLDAAAGEAMKRKKLLDWPSPNADLATLKLLHLLAQVLAAGLPFDEGSLASIRAEVARLHERGLDDN